MTPPETQTSAAAGLEPGSFRDPESRVFYAGDAVYRALSAEGLEDFEAVEATGLLADERIVGTERTSGDGLPGLLTKETAGVLKHERIPSVSYPYEWTFSMLKDAALLQLDLLLASLEHDLVLKDSTPYNVQFKGARPTFVDVGSFERRREGEPWVGYRQFCMLYLYPLLLQSVKEVPFQPWLRGSIDGISPAHMRSLASFRDRFRRGWPTNVFLHARLEQRYGDRGGEVKRDVKKAGFNKQILVANVRKMKKLVERLEWSPPEGVWVAYGERNSYTDDDARRKDEFVREVAGSREWPLVWDIGCNNGRYARIVAEGAKTVVAVDADQGPVELLYRTLRDEGDEKILTLTMNLADPSPGLGWRGLERKSLPERGKPDLVLALALIHHVTISANVPVKEFLDWLAGLGSSLVIEFPIREDPMVKKLLAPKREGLHPDYELGFFERCLHEAFEVERSERLESGTRVLYYARPKGG